MSPLGPIPAQGTHRRWIVNFEVIGTPRPQGSKRYLGQRGGRPILAEQSPGLSAWRSDVRSAAAGALGDRPAIAGPLEVGWAFRFTRPKRHHVAGDRSRPLRPDAPRWHDQVPDASKLVRACEDALNGLVWRDDAQLARQVVTKAWADPGEREGVSVTVRELDR